MGIFKAYDVRGRYPSEIDESVALRLGHAVARYLKGRRLAVGRDVRISAPAVARAVCEGITRAGAHVLDLGMCTTPMLYFAVGQYGLDGGIMVTASHNPPDWIGFKICREKAFPVGERTGLKEIESLARETPAASNGGRVEERGITGDYREHLRRFLSAVPDLKIVVDAASGAVAGHFDEIFGDLPVRFVRLCFLPDGRFPNHEPNPLKDENVRDSAEAVVREKADLAVCFDGDGDRCIFLGPDGRRIQSDLVTVLLARAELRRSPGAAIVYDLRSSRVVPEEIARAGGRPIRERVGHAFIKETMRANGAVLGGELSGHYYFRDHFFADSGMMAFTKLLDLLGRERRPIADLLAPLRRKHATGEINFHVEDKAAMMETMARLFADARQDRLDGITIEYPDWWFNLRPSNTEPLLRLNLEADAADKLEWAKGRLFEVLGRPE
ncbi:MAG: phosphomannomutase/phosphoglucomutase [Planctomycetes bacterium]|nr:phosphomannomutase/phosphoglucomutase [Planctomycetota bacterium]